MCGRVGHCPDHCLSAEDARLRDGHRTGGVGGPLRGREICDRTVGIVGTGAIGTKTAQLFLAFGAKVIAYSRTVRPEVEAMGVEYTTLEDVMSRSDIVSIHTPNNAETKGMISKELIAKMRPDAILVNVARGAIVDQCSAGRCPEPGQAGRRGHRRV